MTLRTQLKKVHALRSTYYLWLAWKERLHWGNEETLYKWLDKHYERIDAWNYTGCALEEDRFRSALEMLDTVRDGILFNRAFEVGCAEGVFTSMLASRCESLLAVDISQKAMTRAITHCTGMPVRFEEWDVIHSPAPTAAPFDLVVIMDVLEMFHRPVYIRTARNKLAATVRPGGYLLLGNSRQCEMFETAWWGRWMMRGGKRIAELFSRHPELEEVASEMKGLYVNKLFRKKGDLQ